MTDRIVETSAVARIGASPDVDERAARIRRGLVRISTVDRLEVGSITAHLRHPT